jgi:hypothetical protein
MSPPFLRWLMTRTCSWMRCRMRFPQPGLLQPLCQQLLRIEIICLRFFENQHGGNNYTPAGKNFHAVLTNSISLSNRGERGGKTKVWKDMKYGGESRITVPADLRSG